nr:hypothetical protein [uncultured Draconibacterium sp.]
MTKEQAVELFRKANEDLTIANLRKAFKAKSGEENLIVGGINVVLPIDNDTTYATADEYEIVFNSAKDGNGTNIKDALKITNKTANGFTVTSTRAGVLRWETHLKTPDFNFWD